MDTTPAGDAFLAATLPAVQRVEADIERALGIPLDEYRGPLERLRTAAQAVMLRGGKEPVAAERTLAT